MLVFFASVEMRNPFSTFRRASPANFSVATSPSYLSLLWSPLGPLSAAPQSNQIDRLLARTATRSYGGGLVHQSAEGDLHRAEAKATSSSQHFADAQCGCIFGMEINKGAKATATVEYVGKGYTPAAATNLRLSKPFHHSGRAWGATPGSRAWRR